MAERVNRPPQVGALRAGCLQLAALDLAQNLAQGVKGAAGLISVHSPIIHHAEGPPHAGTGLLINPTL